MSRGYRRPYKHRPAPLCPRCNRPTRWGVLSDGRTARLEREPVDAGEIARIPGSNRYTDEPHYYDDPTKPPLVYYRKHRCNEAR